MTTGPENHQVKSAIVGNLKLPPPGEQEERADAPDPNEKVPMLIELNARYPGGLATVRAAWYPKASFLAGENLQAVTGPDSWGGMGADGFQPAGAAQTVPMPANGGLAYGFTSNTFYRVNAASVINNTKGEPFSGAHSDIQKMPVAQLIVAAAAAHA
jgi:hypothetical protein